MRELVARCEWELGAELGEAPVWVAGQERAYFVDIKAGRVHALQIADGQRYSWQLPDYVCWLVPRRDGDGFIAGLRRQVVRLWLEPQLRIDPLPVPLPLPAEVRLNDAKADCHGNLWFGTMNNVDTQRPDGRLFRLDRELGLTEQERGLHICNGPAFSTDGQVMYHTDTFLGRISAYPVGPTGVPGAGRLWRQFDKPTEGAPDGMTVDSEGGIWVAQWGAARVCRYLPDATLDTVVRLPVSQPSSCAFGGPGLATLYITSARQDLKPERLAAEPLAGALFSIATDVPGLPPARFG